MTHDEQIAALREALTRRFARATFAAYDRLLRTMAAVGLPHDVQAAWRQWAPLAVRDEVLAAWTRHTTRLARCFLERYNAFVRHDLPHLAADDWSSMWRDYRAIDALASKVRTLGDEKYQRLGPILAAAAAWPRPAESGAAFGPLDDATHAELEARYQELESLAGQAHLRLLAALAHQENVATRHGLQLPPRPADEPPDELPAAGDQPEDARRGHGPSSADQAPP